MKKNNKGNRTGCPKLDSEQVKAIRKKYAEIPESTTASIGKDYNVTQACIYKVVHNHTWHDPDYTPPEIKMIRVRREVKAERKPAIEYPFQWTLAVPKLPVGMRYGVRG